MAVVTCRERMFAPPLVDEDGPPGPPRPPGQDGLADQVLAGMHPAVREWFLTRFPDGPTEPQVLGWPRVAAGEDTLIAAPTGSGKTLAGFLMAIDALYRAAEAGEEVEGTTQVVYVSPLKALAVDIQQNLETPLREIAEIAVRLGRPGPGLRAEVRNGDTTASARAAMLRRPPNFLVTTPESLYLMVTAERARATLASVHTVIVDEIHAVARDKRGSHLTLTLERLEHLCDRRPVRVGLSATQRPIETVARLLVGAGPDRRGPGGEPRCAIVDVGHQRQLDLAIELPDGELEAVASAELLAEMLDRIAGYVDAHRTTLVFVNTRRLAERIAHLLGERLGDDVVASHHGSLSKERRLRVETRLRAGELRALVATASLELGIDIGPVELVCQIASPRSMATFLQRVGRSGHHRGGLPKGRLFPMTRDELVECCALLAGVRAGRLDAISPPVAPLDILAQQIVAESSASRWREDDLYQLVRRAAPYADLSREEFDEVVGLVSDGIVTGRGRRAAYVHRDRINGELSGRRGARLAALTSGGAIPETGDYRVVADPDDTFVGTVIEDWAIESMAGDVFLLGSTSWRIRRVEPGTVRVVDAGGAPPSVPFWLGEAPARTVELSEEVSNLRAGVDRLLGAGKKAEVVREDPVGAAVAWVAERSGVTEEVAAMVVRYLAASQVALGGLPTIDHIYIERFFDDSGGMQLIVHAPFGGRINRALGLALRKRFCVSFDFELQAAANDDAVLLSLGPQHSFPLDSVARFLSSATVAQVLRQAALASPMFAIRWRWNLNRSLAVLRFRGGRKNPPPIQRMEADDLMVAVFPAHAACQENVTGPIEIPDHPLVRQTMHDCLTEAMDVEGLVSVVKGLESGAITVTCRDSTEPSPLSHEILNGRPYTFLDDAPLEERRSRAVTLRRGLPVDARDLAALDPDAIARVRAEAAPEVRDADELHDLLLTLVVARPTPGLSGWYEELLGRHRAASAVTASGQELWYAAEQRDQVEVLFPGATGAGALAGDAVGTDAGAALDGDAVAASALRGHLDTLGPVTVSMLANATALDEGTVAIGLARLQQEGFALSGDFEPWVGDQQWCSRRLLARIHGYTQKRLRREIEPVTAQDLMRFLLRWHHVAPGTQRQGRSGLIAVIEQLQGCELPAGTWESQVLPARIERYRPGWLDELCHSGQVAWGRIRVRDSGGEGEAGGSAGSATGSATGSASITSRATPITLLLRADLAWLMQSARGEAVPSEPAAGASHDIIEALRQYGAMFLPELATAARRLPAEVETALWDGVARGLLTADGFSAVRSLLAGRQVASHRQWQARRGLRRGASAGRGVGAPGGASGAATGGGRWSLLPVAGEVADRDALAEAVAEQLLARWGVVFRDLVARETLALPWRDVLWALRRMEARGTARGGRFVTGFTGEQYALPEAVEQLRKVRRTPRTGETVRISATDPLNLVGIITPGPRVPAVRTNTVTYVDGLPVAADGVAPVAADEPRSPSLV
ncbi:MAG: DEAD/DEAH box helicase [Actinomycetota bacterium]|nr:DEAD/DEAH box helicase [Actinomycetota bacterium]